ncbi:hypothetical protein V9T40_010486 [Parthenolecanium corni]|uniref:Uncharacterized protein n=1 Tax=Parthenolecanium corni TaxID=536013 RepID=A0AAN9TAP8_9HEMI
MLAVHGIHPCPMSNNDVRRVASRRTSILAYGPWGRDVALRKARVSVENESSPDSQLQAAQFADLSDYSIYS